MVAPERKAGCVFMDLSFQSITLAPRGSIAWGGQVEENTVGAGFRSDCAFGAGRHLRESGEERKEEPGSGGAHFLPYPTFPQN